MRKRLDLVGQTFGRLTVTQLSHRDAKQSQWMCSCTCGGQAVVGLGNLRSGKTLSCGCLQRDAISAARQTHGRSRSPEYRSWSHAKERCTNPNVKGFEHWGGRGIMMCERWRNSFEAFFADMGPKPSPQHSIDRIDNDGPYSPQNCRWATRTQQARNKSNRSRIVTNETVMCIPEAVEKSGLTRSAINHRRARGWSDEEIMSTEIRTVHLITYRGETLSVAGWAKRFGIQDTTLHTRLARGWPLARALTEPVKRRVHSAKTLVDA